MSDKSGKKKANLSTFELSIMGLALVLFIGFVLVGGEKGTEEATQSTNTELSYYSSDSPQVASSQVPKSNLLKLDSAKTTPDPTVEKREPNSYSIVYVSIDSMKLRSDHHLQAEMIAYLAYGQAVTNLGEYSVVERIKIAKDRTEVAPWIKIKTEDGKIGWVFGAGLTFYPLK